MTTGSLREWLGRQRSGETHGLRTRVQIAMDVAYGLHYLHNFTKPGYVHKNINSSNILLDSNQNRGYQRVYGSRVCREWLCHFESRCLFVRSCDDGTDICVKQDPASRTTMDEVVSSLVKIQVDLQMMKKAVM